MTQFACLNQNKIAIGGKSFREASSLLLPPVKSPSRLRSINVAINIAVLCTSDISFSSIVYLHDLHDYIG